MCLTRPSQTEDDKVDKARWSKGMILASAARAPGLKSRTSPRADSAHHSASSQDQSERSAHHYVNRSCGLRPHLHRRPLTDLQGHNESSL